MQVEKYVRLRNMSIAVTLFCVFVILQCYMFDTGNISVEALKDYISYSSQCVKYGDSLKILPDSCSVLLRDDSRYKSNPEHEPILSFDTVEQMEEFVAGWTYGDSRRINPYINAYIKQSLWEYADWCINEESDDYWHMKYVASQMTGGYSYARQIKYKWYKLLYENSPFIFIVSTFTVIFVNVFCFMYMFKGATEKKRINGYVHSCVDREGNSVTVYYDNNGKASIMEEVDKSGNIVVIDPDTGERYEDEEEDLEEE